MLAVNGFVGEGTYLSEERRVGRLGLASGLEFRDGMVRVGLEKGRVQGVVLGELCCERRSRVSGCCP